MSGSKSGSKIKSHNLPKELVIRSIKVVDIGYIAVIYFCLAFFLSALYDKVLGKFDTLAADKKSTITLFAEVIVHIWCIGITVYIVRNLVELIPFPLNGVYGFEHKRVKELSNAAVFTFILLFFQKHLREKLDYLYVRVFSKN